MWLWSQTLDSFLNPMWTRVLQWSWFLSLMGSLLLAPALLCPLAYTELQWPILSMSIPNEENRRSAALWQSLEAMTAATSHKRSKHLHINNCTNETRRWTYHINIHKCNVFDCAEVFIGLLTLILWLFASWAYDILIFYTFTSLIRGGVIMLVKVSSALLCSCSGILISF